jgi:hypothetical protein
MKLSWIDTVTIAAVIIGAIALGWFSEIELHPRAWRSGSPAGGFISGARKVRDLIDDMTPAVFGFAVVGLARALWESDADRRLLFRQPGVAACAAAVAALAAGVMSTAMWAVRCWEFSEPSGSPRLAMVITYAARHLTSSVLVIWAFLALSGLWMRGRNWVNWLGCAIGFLAIVNSALWFLP